MVNPTVNPNGTAPEQLMEALRAAHTAVVDAVVALAGAAPNPVDYPDDFAAAFVEHEQRMALLHSVQEDLLAQFDSVEQQVREGARGHA